MAALTPGIQIDRYRVEGALGSGSMGDVVRGIDHDLKRPVAIKILSERHRENEELRARFLREGRAVAAISHPNVVQVFTTGQYDRRPYIAMELLRGVDLGTVVKRHGVMTSVQAARATLDAARGLEAAAEAGLIHRDVKPSNLVLLDAGVVKVTDFGLAKPIDPNSEPALTAMGVVVGTPDYIAPEQARGDAIDQRVDIYALGGTLYFLLTGIPPFRTGNPSEDKYLKVVARHLKEPAPDPRVRSPSVDKELATLARTMMAKKADDRPTYPALVSQLEAIVDRLQRGGADASQPRVGGGPATPEPTPFVGGASPRAASVPAVVADAIHDDESAATTVRPTVASGASIAALAPTTPRWLLVVTALSALVFVAGLALFLFGPRPAAPAPVAAAPIDASVADAAPPPPPPAPPPGMALLHHADGSPWLFVDLAPVSHGDVAAALPSVKKAHRSKRLNAKPVVDIAFADAEAYARSQDKRLVRPDEWQAAQHLDGWTSAGSLWEWVDDGSRGEQARQSVLAADDKSDRRPPRASPTVTFRLARDLPGAAPPPGR
jgi:hypothetical protein